MQMDSKNSNLGFYSGPMTSTLTGEEVLALWRQNGQNRPVTRPSLAEQILSYQQTMSSQPPKKDEPSKNGPPPVQSDESPPD